MHSMSGIYSLCFLWLLAASSYSATEETEEDIVPMIDPKGYLVYCPCMGRFGNQVDHFLGSLNFAKALDRTLILPPWIEYRQGAIRSTQVPFNAYFQIKPLEKFHRVITMKRFMTHLADEVWPKSERRSLCFTERKSLHGGTSKGCYAKEGNPFGPFWDEFDIDFVGSEFFSPLTYDTKHSHNMAERWATEYPPSKWRVLAFTGAPASFPVQAENVPLQKYLVWTKQIQNAASNWVRSHLPKGAFIGIHLRNGVDWGRACTHISDSPNLFSAAQCLGYRNELGNANADMCMPSKEIILKQLRRQIKRFNDANDNNDIRSIFVASDNNHMIAQLNEGLKLLKVTAHRLDELNPHLDLAILEISNVFIGNCISSYSAYVKRARDVRGFPSSFWAFPKENYLSNNSRKNKRDEL